MTVSLFLVVRAPHACSSELREYLLGEPLSFLIRTAGLESVDVFLPEAGRVAAFEQDDAPALLLQIEVATEALADSLARAEWFRSLLLDPSAWGVPLEGLSLDVCETRHFPVAGRQAPSARTAPLSFVVRYYGPTADLAAFDRFYVDNHPPILARFPGIRNVLCYLPMNWRSTGPVRDSRLILGNEVVFDDLAALNGALESDVLPLLIADGKRFASFGSNSHHAMRRERIEIGHPRRR